jgi:hypothetical protein
MCRRPWFAVVCAYVVAFQILLSSAIATQMQVAAATLADSASVICSEHGQSSDPDHPGQSTVDHAPCVLCSFAKAAAGTLTVELRTLEPKRVSFVVVPTVAKKIFIPYRPLTSRYQRGPPRGNFAAV